MLNLLALIAIPIGVLKRLEIVVNSPLHSHLPIWILYSIVDFEGRKKAVLNIWLVLAYSTALLIAGLKWPLALVCCAVLLVVALSKMLAIGWMDQNAQW